MGELAQAGTQNAKPRTTLRLDLALVESRLFESRSKAREAIEAGLVTIDGRPAPKASVQVAREARLHAVPPYPWVSRGGVKLAAGLDAFAIDPAGRICLDVGASTGGFTDVLLARGAAHVYAVDVGRDQLHPRLRHDARVSDWSETDIRRVEPSLFVTKPSLVVCDASFISLTLVLPAALPLASPNAQLVALIKPQFEVGRGGTHRGVVRDQSSRDQACRSVSATIERAGWRIVGLRPSPITGGDGNIEYLVGACSP